MSDLDFDKLLTQSQSPNRAETAFRRQLMHESGLALVKGHRRRLWVMGGELQ